LIEFAPPRQLHRSMASPETLMDATERLSTIQLKVERAIKHIDELAVACKQFIDATPFTLGRVIDPHTGYYNFTVNDLKSPPPQIGLMAGDVIHNLRSALDHLAYQLVIVNGNTPSRHTCFPIFDDPAKLSTMDQRKVSGMSPAAIAAITAARPYRGGNEPLWIVHELDIADKHHALLTTLVSVTQLSIEMNVGLRNFKAPPFAAPNFQEPLKNGDVFFICKPGVEDKTKIDFDVALCEPEIIRGKPLGKMLGRLLTHVNETIINFEPLLA
jgi:hypothetical protein